jgi:hypothetical protein
MEGKLLSQGQVRYKTAEKQGLAFASWLLSG